MQIKNKRLFITIFLASVAMTGFIVLLTVWFLNAYHLKRELFDYRVNVAQKSIVNQMIEIKHQNNKAVFCEHFCHFQNQNVVEHIDKHALDSIIYAEFESLKIDPVYEYAVYRGNDREVLIQNKDTVNLKLFESPYTVSLSCVSSCADPSNIFYLSFIFPDNVAFILKQLAFLVIFALLLFIILVYSYYRTIMYYLTLQRLSDLKADFINNMTHEFKTPLATISLAGEMLTNEVIVSDKIRREKYLLIIKSENDRLKSQVNKILQIAMIEKEELAYEIEAIEIHNIIEQCLKNFEVLLKEKEVKVDVSLQKESLWIKADKIHLYNVLSNLVDNALKYNSSEKPMIWISTSVIEGLLHLKIRDNGIGIPKLSLPYIFNQFYRVPTGNIHNIKGFGLGLYYVKMVLNKFGGSISVVSEIGKGTEFTIKLPVAKG